MELINRTEDKTGMDPYKVLGVTPQTSDDDVKRAYRELARKYHPDNYAGNPLADLAETRMKEINEAYDMIMNARSKSREVLRDTADGLPAHRKASIRGFGTQSIKGICRLQRNCFAAARHAMQSGNF